MPNGELFEKAARLKALHVPGRPLILPNVWDAGSAKIVAAEGYPAIATTSAGIAFSLGYPDGEFVPRAEMLGAIRRIAAAVGVPVSADVEAGYGLEPEAVAATVSDLIAAGVAGANIQDRRMASGDALFDFDVSVARIAAARRAADAAGVPFVVNARTDAFIQANGREPEATFAEAVRRLSAYRRAGADCLFAPFAPDRAAAARLVRALDGPLNMLQPAVSVADLASAGVARVSFGATVARSAYGMAKHAAREIRDRGTASFAQGAIDNREINALMARTVGTSAQGRR